MPDATYTPGSSVARDQVRRLLPDMNLTGATLNDDTYTLATYTYTDAQLDDYLHDEGGDVFGAAALALETTVAQASSSAAKVSGYGFSIDDTAGYSTMLGRAAALRARSAAGVARIGTSRAIDNQAVW